MWIKVGLTKPLHWAKGEKKIPEIISREPTGVHAWEHGIMLCGQRSVMFDKWEEKESEKSLLESEREKEKDSILELAILSA